MLHIARDDLARMFPRAIPEWLDALDKLGPALADFYDFERLDWVHLVGQIGAETDGLRLRNMQENMYFTTRKRVLAVYKYRLGVALKKDAGIRAKYRTRTRLADALLRNPKMLADVVYGGREGTPWMAGSCYIGRGPTQITHRDNYAEVARHLKLQDVVLIPDGIADRAVDLVENPELLAEDPELGIRSAFADFEIKKLSRWARQDNVDAVSATLNTGGYSAKRLTYTNNLSGRRQWVAKAKGIWPEGSLAAPATAVSHEIVHETAQNGAETGVSTISRGSQGLAVEAAQRLLIAKGFVLGTVDGHYGPLMARAVAAFQDAYHLPIDGDLDADDMVALRGNDVPDLGDRAIATDVPGSDQIAAGKLVGRSTKTGLGLGVTEGVGNAFGFSPFNAAMDVLGRAGEAVSKVSSLGLAIQPKHVAIVVVCLAAPPMWLWARKTIAKRVEAHRTSNFTR